MRHEAIFNNRVHSSTWSYYVPRLGKNQVTPQVLWQDPVIVDGPIPAKQLIWSPSLQSYSIWTLFRLMKGRWWGHPSYYQISQFFNVVFMKKVCYISGFVWSRNSMVHGWHLASSWALVIATDVSPCVLVTVSPVVGNNSSKHLLWPSKYLRLSAVYWGFTPEKKNMPYVSIIQKPEVTLHTLQTANWTQT